MAQKKTTVGKIDQQVLAYTAGRDIELDGALVRIDCIGTAAHVTMLSKMDLAKPILTSSERDKIITQLVEVMEQAEAGRFKIRLSDQDVHLAVERTLTEKLGDIGKKTHTGRSRNDQVAVDLRLYSKEQLLCILDETVELAQVLVRFGKQHKQVPMVGRTHMQPGMPSSVGLWATAHAESILDDALELLHLLDLNDQSPLGSAASYGVPLPIDRELSAKLMGFSRATHNVLYANNSRGKCEGLVLSGMAHIMLTLSRLAQDMMLFTMPEFNYFQLPAAFCTGSSIMPQKQNPDVCELVRARASRVKAAEEAVYQLVKGAPSGYNRDLQEAKEPFMEGIAMTRASLQIMTAMMAQTKVNKKALVDGFTPEVFATDRALEYVSEGMPFRDAYHKVKEELSSLCSIDPQEAIEKKDHYGAPSGLQWELYIQRLKALKSATKKKRSSYERAVSKLMGVPYKIIS
jgi:argininosuccinate lyase